MKKKITITVLFLALPYLISIEKIKAANGNIQTTIASTSKPILLQKAPFTSQAPFGKWSDQRQEDGCEEASTLMAVRWAQGKTISKDQALQAILGSSDFTKKKYHEYRDISTKDTFHWILKDYFKYNKAALLRGTTKQSIINELKKGNVVIAPMNGQRLRNPNFIAPGPIHHMLLIIGYDEARKVFITNDPGTRNGAQYTYNEDLLFGAIRDYPTGWHLNADKIEKNVITVWK